MHFNNIKYTYLVMKGVHLHEMTRRLFPVYHLLKTSNEAKELKSSDKRTLPSPR